MLCNGLAFRSCTYTKISARLLPNADDVEVCIDSGFRVTLYPRAWFLYLLPEVKIRKMASPHKVLGLGASKHETSEYVTTPRYLPAVEKDTDKNAHDQGVSTPGPDCKQARTRPRGLND